MSDEQEQLRQQHWRELALQLGLPLDAEPASEGQTKASPPSSTHSQETPRPVESKLPSEVEPEARKELAAEEEDSSPRGHRRRRPAQAREDPPASLAVPLAPVSEPEVKEPGLFPASPELDPAEEEGPRRRRRGRRSGRSSRPAESTAGVEPLTEEAGTERPEESEEAVAEKPRERSRRGRGRGRHQKTAVEEAPPEERDEAIESEEEVEEDEAAAPAEEPEDGEEEMDTLSDWNVPSWTELIASLYRPER